MVIHTNSYEQYILTYKKTMILQSSQQINLEYILQTMDRHTGGKWLIHGPKYGSYLAMA